MVIDFTFEYRKHVYIINSVIMFTIFKLKQRKYSVIRSAKIYFK